MSIIERRNCKRRMSGIEKMGIRKGHFGISWDEGRLRCDNANNDWNSAIRTLLARAQQQIMMRLDPLASETSASCLLVDRNTLNVTRTPRMYN